MACVNIPAPFEITQAGAPNGQPKWSPDGEQIVFVSNKSGSWQVWKMDADGSNQRRITDDQYPAGWPSWSPDGNTIYYYSGLDKKYRLQSININGSNHKFILDDEFSDFRPSISHDGQFLLFDRWGASTPKNHDLFVKNLLDGSTRRLISHTGYDSDAKFSPNDDRLVFQSDRNGIEPYDTDIFILDLDSGKVTQITHGEGAERNLYPDWCPDGNWISYVSETDGERNIFAIRLRDGYTKQLTTTPGSESEPAWALDGKQLAFSAASPDETTEIAILETPFCAEPSHAAQH